MAAEQDEFAPIDPNVGNGAQAPAPVNEPAAVEPPADDRARFELKSEFSLPLEGKISALERSAMPAARYDAAISRMGELGNPDTATPGMDEFMQRFGVSAQAETKSGMLAGSLDREDSDWSNEPSFDGRVLRSGWPEPRGGGAQTPEAARALVRSALKMGNWLTAPLWHSGFWIHLRAPAEGELLELYRELANERVTIGRNTYGMLHGNMSVYTSNTIARFVKDHIYNTSLNVGASDFNIFEHISMLDMPSLAFALACASYPAGFQYERQCCADFSKCRHTMTARLNLQRLLFVDRTRFNDAQLRQMSRRDPNSVTIDQLKTYRDAGPFSNERVVKINEDVSICLRVPTLNDHFVSGMNWSSHIETTYGTALTYDEKDRDNYLRSQAKTMTLRDYAHVVASINVGETTITDRDAIDGIVNDMSSQPHLVELVQKAVRQYLEDVTSALVAIPTYKCPECGQDQPTSREGSRYPELIPLDVMNVFFYLLYQKVQRFQP